MMKRRIWMILVVMGVSLSACSAGTPAASEVILGGSISGATLQESAAGERMDFGVEVAQAGEPIGIDARGAVVSGALRVQLVDEAGNVAFAETFDTPGPFALTTVVKPEF
ncbi:MAG: hypothetical protein JXB35_11455, partial [Anaerolineae bacterium]|nr:hypothetical protein [Anaerolineae bacterium]